MQKERTLSSIEARKNKREDRSSQRQKTEGVSEKEMDR